ncbi:hypothetical protein ACIBFB_23705 [Nocardiopsis sp. NPDC050513]|uniref:hypothetical protein n=1 Tax=Nocardiopsis sp. NPDC050513 TaxID=3364338 RepID=UPI003791E2B2
MASSTGHPGAVSRETYWKRRALVLAGALLVLTLIAFACRPSAEDDSDPVRSEAGVADADPSPSVPPETPSPTASGEPEDGASEGAEGDAEGGEDDRDAAESGGGEAAGGSGEDAGAAAAPESPEDACRPQDVVVTFELADEDREVYGSGAEPEFRVTVVNTANQTCTVDVGPEAMEIRIHSGDDRIFSTGDCVEGEAADERQLRRGVPFETTFGWDRQRSFTDCRDATSARPGWYRAHLRGDYAGDTGEVVFQLR